MLRDNTLIHSLISPDAAQRTGGKLVPIPPCQVTDKEGNTYTCSHLIKTSWTWEKNPASSTAEDFYVANIKYDALIRGQEKEANGSCFPVEGPVKTQGITGAATQAN